MRILEYWEIMDKYHESIMTLLSQNGAMGVNAIAIELKAPVSSVQKYLTSQQTYFRKNTERKWDLPEKVAEQNWAKHEELKVSALVNGIETQARIIDSQLSMVTDSMQTLISQFNTIKSSLEVQSKQNAASVAIDPRLLKFTEDISNMQMAIRKNANQAPEIYRDLLSNIDFIRLALNMGKRYVTDTLIPELSALVLKQIETLQPETIALLTEFQINSKVTNRAEEN